MKLDPGTVGLLLVIASLLVISPLVLGHKYLDAEGSREREKPVFVPDHQVSWASYGRISEAGEVDYYRFKAASGEEIYASIVIPKLKRLKDFTPELALIGPGPGGGSSGTDETSNYLDVREDESVLYKEFTDPDNPVFFEPFTQTSYWERQEIRLNAPETGTYHLAVFDSNRNIGKYVLAIGEREVFGARDILALPGTWWKVRMYAEQEFSTYVIAGVVLGGIAVGSFFLVRAFL